MSAKPHIWPSRSCPGKYACSLAGRNHRQSRRLLFPIATAPVGIGSTPHAAYMDYQRLVQLNLAMRISNQ